MFKFFQRFFKARTSVYYIASAGEILPEKLSQEAEYEMVDKMKVGSSEARNQLIERNLRLVVYTAQKFDNTNVCIEDLISIGTIGLIKAVESFDNSKNIKLATYASRCIENEILMHLRKVSKQKQEVSIFEPLNTDSEGNELCISDILCTDKDEVTGNMDKEDEFSNLKFVLDGLNEKEKEIMFMRYGLKGKTEMTQKQVADYFDISQSYISRIEKKILEKMKTAILKLA
jgi:RNA polymerase sporulation-specific sigma factor